MNKDLSLSQLRHTASFNLILFDLLLSEFRQVSTNSTLPPVSPYTSHSPSSLPHHPSSPLTGTRLSKRRWEAHHPSSFAQTVYFLVLFIFMFFMHFCVSFLCCTKYFFIFIVPCVCFFPPSLDLSPLGGLRARLHSSSSVPNFLKFQFLAPVQENEFPESKRRYICKHQTCAYYSNISVSCETGLDSVLVYIFYIFRL